MSPDPAPTFVDLDADSVDEHHLCCALGAPKHADGVARKRAWLKQRFAEGLVFRKLDVRGKVFIEYAPAEVAWRPVVAPGWLVVHCLWVSGRFAKQGHGRALVESALDDARRRGKAGVVVAASKRKRPFLSDPKFLSHLGFEVVDEAGEFRLFARSVAEGSVPRFAESVHRAAGAEAQGSFAMHHDDQCPFNHHWSEQVAGDLRQRGHAVQVVRIGDARGAQQTPSPLGTYGLTRGDALVCHHLTTSGATERLLKKLP